MFIQKFLRYLDKPRKLCTLFSIDNSDTTILNLEGGGGHYNVDNLNNVFIKPFIF